MAYDLLIVGGFAIAGVILILLFIWYFVFGRSFSAIVMAVIGIFLNDRETFDENAPIEPSHEEPLSEIVTRKSQEIPFEVQLPEMHVEEPLAPSRETQSVLRVPGVEQPVRPQAAPPPEGDRGFLKEHIEPSDHQTVDQE
ncbi:MAG: hypothetical protein H6670_03685 [Anaerolineaceae bacterium]|nr:hypothetical protein [Anaerolineaceae bacterium]